MDLTKIKFDLNGSSVLPPKDWNGISLNASFESDQTQADISSQEFSFVGDARTEILNHIDQGYIFEGLPFSMQVKKAELSYLAFKGFLNLQESFVNLTGEDTVTAKIQKLSGLNTIGEKLSGVSFGYLDSIGLVNSESVEYVVEKRTEAIKIIVSSLMIFLMIKELSETRKRISDNITDLTTIITGGGLTGSIGGAVLIAGRILIDLAYSAVMIVAIINMASDLLNSFISPVRKYKICSWFELMRSASEYLGYEFSSSISELKNVYCLPSKPAEGKITSGVPRSSDSGYNCGEFFSIMAVAFAGKIAVIDNTIHFENIDSDFFIKRSTFKMPDVFIEKKRKNAEELAGTRLISFSTDPVDEWTIQNIKGTYFEIKTDLDNYRNGEEYLTIKNVDDRLIPYALGNRKDKLSDLEKILKELAQIVDQVIKTFGGSSNLAGKIQNRVGMLKLGTDSHTVARALYLEGGKVPANHRELFSAKALYENYVKAESFVLSKNGGQKEVFEGVRVLFGFESFLQLVENSYFVTSNGESGKVISVKWVIDEDHATISYWIKDKNKSNRLIERYIEPQ